MKFFQKMRREKFYKKLQKKSLLTSSDRFSIYNMNDLYGGTLSQYNKNVSETFCYVIAVCSYNLYKVLHGASFGEKNQDSFVFSS